MRAALLILICIKGLLGSAQVYSEENSITIPSESAFAIQSQSSDFRCILELGNKQVVLSADKHNSTNQWFTSAIIYSDTETMARILKSTKPVRWALVSVPRIMDSQPNKLEKRGTCEEPNTICQSTWRVGLTSPTKGRNATKTEHCIIHHSAANSGDTNYTQIVRSIYTFHTQSNGWDDIGYNYLIAANGSIYKGRDPEKIDIEQDNVQGAHFCGKNAGTMGVCLIGDLQTNEPTDTQLNALIHLLKWKVKKSALAPLRFKEHPKPGDKLLSVIAGHRDGCSTLCPGDNLYKRLSQIRTAANECSPYLGTSMPEVLDEIKMEKQNSVLLISGSKDVHQWKLFSLMGQLLQSSEEEVLKVQLKGFYILQYTIGGEQNFRIIENL